MQMRDFFRWDGLAVAAMTMLGIALFGPNPIREVGGDLELFFALGGGFGLWWNYRYSWTWTQICFGVMSLALLRVVFYFDHASLYAVLAWAAALAGMLYLQKRHRNGTFAAAVKAPPAAASAAGATQQAAGQPQRPAQAATPEYTFDHRVQRARYTFADIVGMADTKMRLLAAGKEILDGKAAKPRNGMMLFGEPGNGKTLFAESLAGELKVPFLSISYGDTASKWINETPQRVKAVFEQAKRLGVAVLFIDEFDSFVKSRDGAGSHSMDQDLTNVMLTEIVALRGTRIILIAATNYLDKLDPASVREGRFDYKIEIPPPDLEARKALLRKSVGEALGFAAVNPAVLESLAERWEGFSASRLTALGGRLGEMRRDGLIGPGTMPFDTGMRAMRLLVGRKGRLPEDVKAIDEIIMPAQSRDKLRDLAFKMYNVHRLEQIGGRIPSGLVFFGPPGTGKTQAAMALAKESGFAFLKTTGAEMMANPESWDKLVREAKDIRPVIVFVDEADDILRDRRYSNVGTLTNKILTTLDGGGGRVRDIVYVAATNHFDSLDPAAIRGGRLEEKIAFDVPEADDMTRYVDAKLKKLAGSHFACTRETVESLLSALAGRSIADADAVMQKAIDAAAVRQLREGSTEIRPHDVSEAARAVFADQAQR
jgi:transitional endoplasmic reticulum ATPase